MAYYQALEWQERIGGGRAGTPVALPRPAPPTYPLVSSHLLWCFTLNAPPSIIEVDDPIAYATFQHAPIEILNPGQAYDTTQSLADRIRPFTHPHHPRGGNQGAVSSHAGLGRSSTRPVRPVRSGWEEAERSDYVEGGSYLGVPRPGREFDQPGRARGGLEPSEVPTTRPSGPDPRVRPAPRVSTLPSGSVVSDRNSAHVIVNPKSIADRVFCAKRRSSHRSED